MGKATRAEIARRVDAIKVLILKGEETGAIVRYAAAQWEVSERSAHRYMAEARELLKEDLASLTPYALAEHIGIRRALRRKMETAKDYRGALAAAQDEAKLLDLYPAARAEVTGKGGRPLIEPPPEYKTMTKEELDDEIRRLLDKVGAAGPDTAAPDFLGGE